MKIYTRTGDQGETGLFGGTRTSKASARVDSYGEVDELNSVLGICRAEIGNHHGPFEELLTSIQSRLFDMGAELANANPNKALGIPLIASDDIAAMEHAIDHVEAQLTPLQTFVLPGGSKLAAYLHLARCVCRRAERRVVALASEEPVRVELIQYLNRLSDLLFVLARLANKSAGVEDIPWLGRSAK